MANDANPSVLPVDTVQGTALSKDYVEHLRSAHLTLIGASIILAFLAFSPSPSQYEEAKRQLVSIERVDRSKVEDVVYRKYEETLKAWNHSDPVTLLEGDPTVLNVPEFNKQFAIRFEPLQKGFASFVVENALGFNPREPFENHSDPHVFRSLTEFRVFWDSLYLNRRLPVPYSAPAMVFVHPIDRETKDGHTFVHAPFGEEVAAKGLSASLSKGSVSGKSLDFYLTHCQRSVKMAVSARLHAGCRYMYLAGWDEKSLWFAIPVEEGGFSLEVEPQSPFLEQNTSWVRGKFESSFRSLNQLTPNLQDLDLETLRKVLDAEESAKGESFEAVGIKFPSATTKWAGFVVLCGIQLYLWLLLRERPTRPGQANEGTEVAWIGLYRSAIAKGLVFVTIVMLPGFAFASAAFRNMPSRREAWIIAGQIGSVVALIAVSILAWTALTALNSQVQPSQAAPRGKS